MDMALVKARYLVLVLFFMFAGAGCIKKNMKSSVASDSTEGMRHPIYRVGSRSAAEYGDEYLDKIQPILTKYCVGCHACTDSPCQLNLTSWEALERGSSMLNAYAPPPQVLVHNGVSTRVEEGRELDFYRLNPDQKKDKEKWWGAWTWDVYQKFVPDDSKSKAYADLHYRDFFSVTEAIPGTETIELNGYNRSESLMGFLVTRGWKYNAPSIDGFTIGKVPNDLQIRIDEQEQGKLQCIAPNAGSLKKYEATFVHNGMPYLAHRMDAQSYATLLSWLDKVKNKPEAQRPIKPEDDALRALNGISEKAQSAVRDWETFLNAEPLRFQLVAKYLYEHLWYAHFQFAEAPGEFYMLVRSATEPGKEVVRLFADVPSDEPVFPALQDGSKAAGKQRVYYRFVKHTNTLVKKTHVVFDTSAKYLDHLQEIFFQADYAKPGGKTWDPGQKVEYGYNPFETFRAIPAASRARFMYENSRLIFDSIIRGPVCVGRMATYVVDDHFWTWFMNPDADPSVQEWESIDKNRPGAFASYYREATAGTARELLEAGDTRKYREHLKAQFDAMYNAKTGRKLDLKALWSDGNNPNAWLTVYRHETSTSVHHGPNGGAPRSAWLLSYVNFERMYYGISVHFRYTGTATHKLWSWLYFNQHRTEAEDTFLMLLNQKQREELRKKWNVDRESQNGTNYASELITQWAKEMFGKLRGAKRAEYASSGVLMSELGRKVASSVYSRATEGYTKDFAFGHALETGQDLSGQQAWKAILAAVYKEYAAKGVAQPDLAGDFPAEESLPKDLTPDMQQSVEALRQIAGDKSRGFASYLPNVSYLRIGAVRLPFSEESFSVSLNKSDLVYSLVVDRGYRFNNIAFGMNLARNPQGDTISVFTGVIGDFPNLFLDVPLPELNEFISAVKGLTSRKDFAALVERFGVNRTEPKFWAFQDFVHKWEFDRDPLRAAFADISDYQITEMPTDPVSEVK
jgi:hypothetical protein